MNRAIFVLLSLAVLSPAWGWVRMEAPPLATVEWVAEEMVFNGIPMRIQFFRSKASPAEVLAHYRQHWSVDGRRRYVERDLGPWQTIAHEQDDFFLTVQVRPATTGAGAEGYLSQRPFKIGAKPVLGQHFDLPPGSKVVNDIVARDHDRLSRTVLAFNDLSIDDNAAYFRSRYVQAGWTLAGDTAADGKRQLVFQRADAELSLALARQGGGTAVGATQLNR